MEVLFNPFSLARKFRRPLVLDGAMGTLLHSRGHNPVDFMWMSYLNLSEPSLVKSVYEEYIDAGADIITTNTFRTNPYAVNRSQVRDADITKKSVEIALDAAEDKTVLVAGSNAPAEDCYQPYRTISEEILKENHYSHITALYKSGCHFVLNETQSHFDEIKIICRICKDENIPFVVSLYFNESLKINSGEDVIAVINYIEDYSPLAIGFNCIKEISLFNLLEQFTPDINWGFYLNCGTGEVTDPELKCSVTPNQYLDTVKKLIQYSPSFIGGCCGTTPSHILKIKEFIDEKATAV